MAKIGVHWR